MCTKAQCEQHLGKMVQFRTPYGHHIGMIEQVTANQVIVLTPKRFAPSHLSRPVNLSDEDKLDVALAFWGGGYPRAGFGPGAGAGYRYGYGGPGRPVGNMGGRAGYGWGGNWQRWAVSFLVIYVLWGLLW